MNNYQYEPYVDRMDFSMNTNWSSDPFNNYFTDTFFSKGSNNQDFDTEEPYDGFVKGNLFPELYDGYKNYRPAPLKPNSEQEYALLLVQIYQFAAHELNLYLDIYPNDRSAVKKREEFLELYKQAVAQYESQYGALSLDSDVVNSVPWGWTFNNFPWEVNK